MEVKALKTRLLDKSLWKFKTHSIFMPFVHSVPVSYCPASFPISPILLFPILFPLKCWLFQDQIKDYHILSLPALLAFQMDYSILAT